MSHIKIAPSILSADFSRLGEQIKEAEEGAADIIHVDVMDGHFVPNISIGPLVVEAVRKVTRLPLDVHLMIDNPERYIDAFASAGADMLSVHVEASKHLHRLIQSIKEHKGVKAGIAVNPATPALAISPIISEIDFALVMSVNPGFGGQKFIASALEKIALVREMILRSGREIEIEVDGGIATETAASVVRAGADILVAGSAVFGSKDVASAMRAIRDSARV